MDQQSNWGLVRRERFAGFMEDLCPDPSRSRAADVHGIAVGAVLGRCCQSCRDSHRGGREAVGAVRLTGFRVEVLVMKDRPRENAVHAK